MIKNLIYSVIVKTLLIGSVIFLNLGITAELLPHHFPKDHEVINLIGRSKLEYLPSDQIDLLIWNIQKGANNKWEQDFLKISADKEIILLQEAKFNTDTRDLFLFRNFFEWFTATSFYIFYENFVGTGLSNGSTTRATNSFYVKTINREPFTKTPKLALATKYKINDHEKELLVVNIHAINFVSDNIFKFELTRIFNKIKNHNGPLIFAGDFNTWTSGKIKFLRIMADKNDFIEVPFKKHSRTTVFGKPLDHIYIKNLTILSIKDMSHIKSSDHTPLSVSLAIKSSK